MNQTIIKQNYNIVRNKRQIFPICMEKDFVLCNMFLNKLEKT